MQINLCEAGRAFDGQWALRDVSATLESGTITAVLGPNGAGKSTLLRLLAGWLPLHSGSIRFDASRMRPTATHLRRQVMLLNESSEPESLGQLIDDYKADREGIENEVADWFDLLDITKVHGSPSGKMSKGQAYKMQMVGLFVVNPKVWILDEPFSAGLDANGLQTLESQLRLRAKAGGSVVFTSQWPEHARRLADHVIVLHDGKLVWEASPDQPVPLDAIAGGSSLHAVLSGLGSTCGI